MSDPKKNIAIIGIVGLPASYGGFESFTEFLVKKLNSTFNITVYCSSRFYPQKNERYEGVHLKYIPLNANGIQSILYDILAIFSALRYANTLLILGVSGCILLPLLRLCGCRKRIVVNIDGLEWQRNKWNVFAKYFLKISEKCSVKYADVVVGDNKVIADYVAAEYGKSCELIEYGADHQHPFNVTEEALAHYPFLALPYAFNVCRIEPENNVEMILQTFENNSDIPLVMVGNWQKNKYGRRLFAHYSKYTHIYLLNPIYDFEQLNILRSNCKVYLHGHSCGGTNPSLIEAMYLALPIVAFDVNFNRETTENKALYFNNSAELQKIIKSVTDSELAKIAEQMKEIAVRRYTWTRISALYANIL